MATSALIVEKSMALLSELRGQLNPAITFQSLEKGGNPLSQEASNYDARDISIYEKKKSLENATRHTSSMRNILTAEKEQADDDFHMFDLVYRNQKERCDDLKRRLQRDREQLMDDINQIQIKLTPLQQSLENYPTKDVTPAVRVRKVDSDRKQDGKLSYRADRSPLKNIRNSLQ